MRPLPFASLVWKLMSCGADPSRMEAPGIVVWDVGDDRDAAGVGQAGFDERIDDDLRVEGVGDAQGDRIAHDVQAVALGDRGGRGGCDLHDHALVLGGHRTGAASGGDGEDTAAQVAHDPSTCP